MKEDMEYLELDLNESISMEALSKMDLKIDKYPVLIIPKKSNDNFIKDEMLKAQIELNFEKEQDETELVKFINNIEGVMAMIRDEYYGPRKYVVAFSNSLKVKILTDEM